MGRIAQPLDGVLQHLLARILRRHHVDDHGSAAGAQHTEHLGERALRIGKMMDREPGDDAVELRIAERQRLGVALPERDVHEARPGASRLGLFKHLLRGVEGHDRLCSGRQCGRDNARPTGNVKQVTLSRIPQGSRKSGGDIFIRLLREGVERVGLPPKFFRDAFEMIHGLLRGIWMLRVRERTGKRARAIRDTRNLDDEIWMTWPSRVG